MKAKDLIRILQGLTPDTSVLFELGRDEEYREQCAKAELATGECLGYLSCVKVEIFVGDGEDEEFCNIILEQENLPDLDASAKEYDEHIVKTQS